MTATEAGTKTQKGIMADKTSFGRYQISTLAEKRRYGIRGIAFCPICDKAEEATDEGRGEKHAITVSIGRVRIHMRLVHRVKEDPAGSPYTQADIH